jgi:arsenite methyltransferase
VTQSVDRTNQTSAPLVVEPSLHPITACCADLYGHPLAAFLLGDSFHPGGLTLTTELAAVAGIDATHDVLDAGSGRGVSSVHLAETLGCRVTGLTIEAGGVAEGERLAAEHGVDDCVHFVQGDLMAMPAGLGPFDVIVMECVLSTVPDKREALASMRRALKPGGTLAITDVTREGEVPPALEGVTAAALCLAGAVSLDTYASVIADAGFAVQRASDLPNVVGGFIDQAARGLLFADIAVGLGKLKIERTMLEPANQALKAARALANEGRLGYGLVVATAFA